MLRVEVFPIFSVEEINDFLKDKTPEDIMVQETFEREGNTYICFTYEVNPKEIPITPQVYTSESVKELLARVNESFQMWNGLQMWHGLHAGSDSYDKLRARASSLGFSSLEWDATERRVDTYVQSRNNTFEPVMGAVLDLAAKYGKSEVLKYPTIEELLDATMRKVEKVIRNIGTQS